MKYLYIGKIVNTHGIKGEIRLLSNFKYKDKVFTNGFKIYIGKDKIKEEIVNYRVHKQFDMICLKGINNINDVLKYKGLKVFINQEDLVFEKDEYLDEELIDLVVMCNDKEYGIVSDIEINDINDLLVIQRDDEEYLIPYKKELIKSIDFDKKIIVFEEVVEGLLK